jgi:ribose/xylose/arabinose/galactoside ABC-type transport system permease subunit
MSNSAYSGSSTTGRVAPANSTVDIASNTLAYVFTPPGLPPYLLPAFAAAFLGSTSITPGRFNAWESAIAVYCLVVGITGLMFMGGSSFVQDMSCGGALVLAVTLSQLVRGREEQ